MTRHPSFHLWTYYIHGDDYKSEGYATMFCFKIKNVGEGRKESMFNLEKQTKKMKLDLDKKFPLPLLALLFEFLLQKLTRKGVIPATCWQLCV